jgi:hypothetical protein
MNILLLTPDAVGGTLLERMLTIYMQFHQFNQPVIDVGHLELGLDKYYDPNFNREIVSSSKDSEYQSLKEIQEMLESVDHYKIAKLPHYNILSRKDPIDQQVPFYQYLNQNYFIIACRRDNLFEHSLSWGLNKITNQLNVYTSKSKLETFFNIYKNGINLDTISLVQSLDTYRRYLQWCEDHFQIASYYVYEKHSVDIEKYILSLPIFNGQKKLSTWKDVYGQEFNDWNKCHYFSSDLTALVSPEAKISLQLIESLGEQRPADNQQIATNMQESWIKFVDEYKKVADPSWPELTKLEDYENLPDYIKKECREVHEITWHLDLIYQGLNMLQGKYDRPFKVQNVDNSTTNKLAEFLADQHKDFLQHHAEKYRVAALSIKRMHELRILQTTIPIKKQTLAEKKLIVKNFDECKEVYNNWIAKHPHCGEPITDEQLLIRSQTERDFWNSSKSGVLSLTT